MTIADIFFALLKKKYKIYLHFKKNVYLCHCLLPSVVSMVRVPSTPCYKTATTIY